jgi:ferric-dicitrate binding protein FerR (iron transport regulator)
MDSFSTYDNIPWELIAASFQENFPEQESAQLLQWIAKDPLNLEKYEQLHRIWQEQWTDYAFYRKADEAAGWKSLWKRIDSNSREQEGGEVVKGAFSKAMWRWTAAAAIVLLVAGAAYWQFGGREKITRFETAANEQKKVALPDGSTIILKPQTHIQLAGNYNKEGRTVTLSGGEAFFEVQHIAQQPFVVVMGAVSVRDIGTSFTIQHTKDSIKIIVSAGKVACINNKNGETREITAGNSLCFYRADQHFGEIKATDTAGTGGLQFDNVALYDVITVLEKVYDRQIRLNDAVTGQKRFTARHLDGESFENVMKIICTSLNLQYTSENGVIIIKEKDK